MNARMDLARRARDAASEAVLAGGLVGAGEGLQIVWSAGAGSWPVVAAVAALGAIVLALVVRIALGVVGRVPSIARWAAAARGGSVRAIWRGVLAFAVSVTFGGLLFVGAVRIYEARRDHGDVRFAWILAIVCVLLGFVGGVIAFVVDRRVVRRFVGQKLARRELGIAIVAALVSIVAAPVFVVHRALPALTLTAIVILAAIAAAVVGAKTLRVGRHRVARIAALVVVVGAMAGAYAMNDSAPSRGAIVSHGTTSLEIARRIWAFADRDGDRYAGPGVGGADCDDDDPKRSPGALEIPGNGVDENCTGADAGDQGSRRSPRPVSADRKPAKQPNVVLISIDALRADHLGSYGYGRKTSPALDALAASGVRFVWTFTSCPSTRCAIPSMLTGRYASTLRGRAERDDVPTLASAFRSAGYDTAAITCCQRFALANKEMTGFDHVDASADVVRMSRQGQSNADIVVDNALAWLKDRDPAKPYLLWLHLYEPHFPYHAPSGPDFGDRDVDRYDTEIAYADAQLARLLPTLDPATTIVAVTADHGDEFAEHGIRFHARSLYNQVVRIPLIIRAPGATPAAPTTPVSLADVMPTLLELAGVDGPAGMNGLSLAPALHGAAPPARPMFIELIPDKQIKRDMAGVVSPPWKIIWDREANAWSLFDLTDPNDTHDRATDPQLPTLQKLLLETLDRETSRLP
jgi:hypothetical protein